MASVRWFGYGGNANIALEIKEKLKIYGIELLLCHEHPGADVYWSLENIPKFISEADIVLITNRYEIEPAKGTNRLAQAWFAKKACVVYPMPSYLDYAENEVNALVVKDASEAVSAILRLVSDEKLRKSLGDNGYHTAITRLHPHHLITKLTDGLRNLKIKNFGWKPETLVHIVIPHYQTRLDYLFLCLDSVLRSNGPTRHIQVVSSCKNDPTENIKLQFGDKVSVYWQSERLNFSQANNIGLRKAPEATTHFLLLNDDTIIGSECLGKFMEEIGDRLIILNPYSNCDKNWLHNDSLIITNNVGMIDLHPNMNIEGVHNFVEDIRTFDSDLAEPGLLETPFCAFYATLMPKGILDIVGYLNEGFKTGSEDLDYCIRAKRYGINSYWTKNAWVFHFGGKSRFQSELENPNQHKEEDVYNHNFIEKRWGCRPWDKKRIAIWTGPAWELWDLNSYKEQGIGGSETCAGRLAETFASLGYSVTMYGCHEYKEQNGVLLCPWNWFHPDQEYFDLFIASRNLNCIDKRLKAKKVLAWCHDIFFLSGRDINTYCLERVHKFIALSPWHKKFIRDYHAIPENKIDIIPNGINVELFEENGV